MCVTKIFVFFFSYKTKFFTQGHRASETFYFSFQHAPRLTTPPHSALRPIAVSCALLRHEAGIQNQSVAGERTSNLRKTRHRKQNRRRRSCLDWPGGLGSGWEKLILQYCTTSSVLSETKWRWVEVLMITSLVEWYPRVSSMDHDTKWPYTINRLYYVTNMHS